MKTSWTNTLLGLFLLAIAGSLGLSCSKQVTRADTNTNWLRMCDRDSECGSSLECVCGVCTISCNASGACSEFENAACTPTRSCSEASAVCASKEGFEALSLPPASAADPSGEGGGSSILCSRSVEDYVVRGTCAGVDVDCETAGETRSGDTYFEDACGCGCTEALGFGGSGSGGSGGSNDNGNGSGGTGGTSNQSGGTGSSNGSGGSSGSVGGRSSGGNSPVGGTFHSVPAGGNGTGGTPAMGSFGSPTGSGGMGVDLFQDPLCNIPPRDFDPRGVECDDPLRDYGQGSKSQCGRNSLGENLVQNGGFNDDCGCGCWDASPDTCEDEARVYVSRDRDGECNNGVLACGSLDPFIDVCGCGCWKPRDSDSLLGAFFPFEPSQCPAPPAGDEVSHEPFDLGEFGCDEDAVFGTGTVVIRSEEEFESALSECGEDLGPSGLDFSQSTLVLSAVEASPHVSVRYVVSGDPGAVNFGVTAYQYCGSGNAPRGMLAFVVDAEVESAAANTCYLMTCQSLAP